MPFGLCLEVLGHRFTYFWDPGIAIVGIGDLNVAHCYWGLDPGKLKFAAILLLVSQLTLPETGIPARPTKDGKEPRIRAGTITHEPNLLFWGQLSLNLVSDIA